MGLWKKVRKLFKKKDQFQNRRSFTEIARFENMPEALELKAKLEKIDIPVYLLDLRNVGSHGKSNIVLRIPAKFMNLAKEILN